MDPGRSKTGLRMFLRCLDQFLRSSKYLIGFWKNRKNERFWPILPCSPNFNRRQNKNQGWYKHSKGGFGKLRMHTFQKKKRSSMIILKELHTTEGIARLWRRLRRSFWSSWGHHSTPDPPPSDLEWFSLLFFWYYLLTSALAAAWASLLRLDRLWGNT